MSRHSVLRRRRRSRLAIPFVIVLMAFAGSAGAAPTVPSESSAGTTEAGTTAEGLADLMAEIERDDPLVLQMVADEGLQPEDAIERLAWQSAMSPLFDEIRFDPAFGGMWVDDNREGRIQIGRVVSRDADPMRDAVFRSPIAEATDFVDVARSWVDLEGMSNDLGARASKHREALAFETGIDTRANAVYISVRADVRESVEVRTFLEELTSEFEDGLVIETHEKQAESDAACRRVGTSLFCDPPLRGGVRIHVVDSGTCTAGFMAQSHTDTKKYVLTAGHCLENGSGLVETRDESWTIIDVGPIHNWQFGQGGDNGIIRITDTAFWNPAPWVVVEDSPNQNGVGWHNREPLILDRINRMEPTRDPHLSNGHDHRDRVRQDREGRRPTVVRLDACQTPSQDELQRPGRG